MPELQSRDIAPRKRALPLDSDQSIVQASQLAQHARPLAVGVKYRLALADVDPSSDAAPLPPTRDADACHPPATAIVQRVHHRQDTPLRSGEALHAAAHLHARAAPCHLQVGFDRMVKACGSEVGWTRGCVSSKGWKRKMAYLCHGS